MAAKQPVEPAFVPVLVPAAGVTDVVDRLHQMGLVGGVVDGPALGLPGVVMARVVGDDAAAWVLRAPDDQDQTISLADLGSTLSARWPGVLVGAEIFSQHDLVDPVLASAHLPRTSVAVTPRADLMLGVFAAGVGSGTTFHEAVVGEQLVVDVSHGLDVSLDLLVDALVNAKGRSVVLWRIGDHVALHALKRGRHAVAHVWTARWTPFGHPDLDHARDPGFVGDAARFGEVLGLTPDRVVALRAMMRQDRPDLEALVELLDLPPIAVDVLEGRTTVAALPGAVRCEPRPLREEVGRAMRASEHDPAWMRALEEGPRELRPWFLALSLLTLVFGLTLLVDWVTAGGSAFWGVVGLVLALGVVVDVTTRWRRKRRGSTSPDY